MPKLHYASRLFGQPSPLPPCYASHSIYFHFMAVYYSYSSYCCCCCCRRCISELTLRGFWVLRRWPAAAAAAAASVGRFVGLPLIALCRWVPDYVRCFFSFSCSHATPPSDHAPALYWVSAWNSKSVSKEISFNLLPLPSYIPLSLSLPLCLTQFELCIWIGICVAFKSAL